MSGRVDWLTSKQVICTVGNNGESVGTDALVCPPITPMCHPVRQHLLLLRGLGRLLFALIWRTDEGVCPYRLATLLMGEVASPPSPLRME